jgi:predicted Zn-ribbon and HTH transcriptional regulator
MGMQGARSVRAGNLLLAEGKFIRMQVRPPQCTKCGYKHGLKKRTMQEN